MLDEEHLGSPQQSLMLGLALARMPQDRYDHFYNGMHADEKRAMDASREEGRMELDRQGVANVQIS